MDCSICLDSLLPEITGASLNGDKESDDLVLEDIEYPVEKVGAVSSTQEQIKVVTQERVPKPLKSCRETTAGVRRAWMQAPPRRSVERRVSSRPPAPLWAFVSLLVR